MADTTETYKFLDYDGLKLFKELLDENGYKSSGSYLPLSGGTLTGDLVIGSTGTMIRASDGHIVLPSGIEIY